MQVYKQTIAFLFEEGGIAERRWKELSGNSDTPSVSHTLDSSLSEGAIPLKTEDCAELKSGSAPLLVNLKRLNTHFTLFQFFFSEDKNSRAGEHSNESKAVWDIADVEGVFRRLDFGHFSVILSVTEVL